MSTESKQIGIIVDKELKNDIEKYCKNTSQTLSEYIRNLVREDLIQKGIIKIGGKKE